MNSRIMELRALTLQRELTPEEQKEAIQLLRDGRYTAKKEPGEKKPRARKEPLDLMSLLNSADGGLV